MKKKIDIAELVGAVLKNDSVLIDNSERHFFGELNSASSGICGNYKTRVVLLSGPSGSGKTTTANILKSLIVKGGRKCSVLSLDDFFLNKGKYPKKNDGSDDYESIYALDLKLLEKCICDLIVSGRAFIPKFDFKSQSRLNAPRLIDVGENGIVIIEGIHALNPLIFDAVNANFSDDMHEVVKRVFVSVASELYYNGEKVFGSGNIRMLRRTIRDDLYRGFDIENTLGIWDDVLAAEKNNITRYKKTADIRIDTFHEYEVFVYAGYIKNNMVSDVEKIKNSPYYCTFKNVMLLPEISLQKVPQNSLIREFIPGGEFENA